jgi:hypothetical protein
MMALIVAAYEELKHRTDGTKLSPEEREGANSKGKNAASNV